MAKYRNLRRSDVSDAWVLSEWIDAGVIELVRCSYFRSAKLITMNCGIMCAVFAVHNGFLIMSQLVNLEQLEDSNWV